MPKFLAVWYQIGGCDYTIGCGVRVEQLEASSIDGAAGQVVKAICDTENLDDDTAASIERVELYRLADQPKSETKIEGMTLDGAVLSKARKDKREVAKTTRKDQKEREEYDRLRKKFDK